MNLLKDINADLTFLKERYNVSKPKGLITNRGIHALICYRLSHLFDKYKIPLIPLLLTRFIQILYGIDIDYKAILHGGIIIIHGTGIVIGNKSVIHSNTIIYHQVTLGIKGSGKNDGFPTIESGCTLGAGAKLYGKVLIEKNSIIGSNCVVTCNVPSNSIVKPTLPVITSRT